METNTKKLSLENAITHLKQDLLDNDKWCASDKCRQDHEQLLAFLLELQEFRNEKKANEPKEQRLKRRTENKQLSLFKSRFINLVLLLHKYYEGDFKDAKKLRHLNDKLIAMSKTTLMLLDFINAKNLKKAKR